ncbi:MAG: Gfo/Idh/MocA family protein [Armatimonadota bacterium]
MAAGKVRVGLIGCGNIMGAHISNLSALKQARVVALADTRRAQLVATVAKHPELEGVPLFSDYRKMIKNVDLDGVVIATPHSFHFEQITACLKAGLHVLIEKPMVCSVQHAKQVVKLAEKTGKVLMISYQRHYSPAHRLVKRMIEQGKIGKLTYISAVQAQDWLRWTKGGWRHNPKLSCGGQLNDAGSHLIDGLLWVTGLQPESVFAEVNNRGTRVDIISGVTVKFKGGAIGTLAVVGDAPGWWEDLAFFGEEGTLYLRRDYLRMRDDRLIKVTRGSKLFSADVEEIPVKSTYSSNADKNFVNSILGKDEPQTPPIYGLRVMQLTEAAWESARTGAAVKAR